MDFYYLFQRVVHGKPNFGHLNARTVNLSTSAHHTRNPCHLTDFLCATSTQVKPTNATHLHTQGINLPAAVLLAVLRWSSKHKGKYLNPLAVGMELLDAGVWLGY